MCLRTVGYISGAYIDNMFQELVTPNFPLKARLTFNQSLLTYIMDRHEMVVNTINIMNSGRLPINLRNSAHSSCDGSSTRPDSMNVM